MSTEDTVEYYGGTYPDKPEEKQTTLKVECYFTTYITVYGDDRDNWEEQIDSLDKYDLLEEADKINIDSWEEI